MRRHLPRALGSLAAIVALAVTPPLARAEITVGRIGDPPSTGPAAKPAGDAASADLVEFLRKKTALKDDDVPARLALAQWAAGREMWTQAAETAREVLDHEPDNRPAYRVLQQVDDAVQLPAEPKTEASLKAEFKRRFNRDFKTRNSRHFVLCYDTSDAFAAQRGGSLEKSYDAFMAYFTMNRLRPAFLEHRLVVILFQNRDDYLKYAKSTEGASLEWAAGYYSQRTNRSAFYDDSTSPEAVDLAKNLGKYRARLQDLNTQIADANAHGNRALVAQLAAERNYLAEALGRIDNKVGNVLGMLNTTKTAHEAAHQLAFNTGIQKRLVDYPLWFSEGLACCFEVEDRNNRRGPTVLNWGRIDGVRELMAADKLVPLDKFIFDPRPDAMNEATLTVVYSEGWALFHFLYRTNRLGMEKYLSAYNGEKALTELPVTEQRKLFTDAFGPDLNSLDNQFKAYLRTLPVRPTP